MFNIGNPSFKGHGMLAPFTPGWQIADVNPLVIEKAEVHLLVTFQHYVTWKYHKELSFPNPLISYKNIGLVMVIYHGCRVPMFTTFMGRNISTPLLVYGPHPWVFLLS